MLEEPLAFGIVVGCSLFGILWGVANIFLVRTSTLYTIILINFGNLFL